MRRIAEARKVRVVRRHDEHLTPRPNNAVKLLHHPDYVRYVLYDVDRLQTVEGIVLKGIREPIKLDENIRFGVRIAIDPNGARALINAAADVEVSHGAGTIVPQPNPTGPRNILYRHT